MKRFCHLLNDGIAESERESSQVDNILWKGNCGQGTKDIILLPIGFTIQIVI